MKLRPAIFLTSLLILSFVGFGMLGVLFIFIGVFSIGGGSIGVGLFTILFSVGFLVLNWLLWKSTKEKMQFVSLDHETLKIFRPLNGKRIEVKTDRIRGYSKSLDDKSYGLKRNCLTIYFIDDLPPVEFVQYQANNIKGFEVELKELKINFLGNEEIYRNGFGQRTRFAYERYEPQ